MDPTVATAESSPLATVDIIIIVAFLVIVTIVGYMMSNVASKGMKDYFLGGKRIPWWVLGISTATSNFDMAGTMIIVAVVFSLGYKGFLVELRGGVGMSLAFLMIFLGKWLRRSRVMTSAEWMKIRFGTDQARAKHGPPVERRIAEHHVVARHDHLLLPKAPGSSSPTSCRYNEIDLHGSIMVVHRSLVYTLLMAGLVRRGVHRLGADGAAHLHRHLRVGAASYTFAMRGNVVFPEGFLEPRLGGRRTGMGASTDRAEDPSYLGADHAACSASASMMWVWSERRSKGHGRCRWLHRSALLRGAH